MKKCYCKLDCWCGIQYIIKPKMLSCWQLQAASHPKCGELHKARLELQLSFHYPGYVIFQENQIACCRCPNLVKDIPLTINVFSLSLPLFLDKQNFHIQHLLNIKSLELQVYKHEEGIELSPKQGQISVTHAARGHCRLNGVMEPPIQKKGNKRSHRQRLVQTTSVGQL